MQELGIICFANSIHTFPYNFFFLVQKQKCINIPFSDLKVFDKVLASIPNDTILQLSNSSTVRYTQLFNLNKTLKVFCNRGTSGIDGSTSTAIGAAVVNKKNTVFRIIVYYFTESILLFENVYPKKTI